MKISTEIGSAMQVSDIRTAVEVCAKAGFDAWDFSMIEMCRIDWDALRPVANDNPLGSKDCLAVARELKKIGLDNGIVCNQAHAPFPIDVPGMDYYVKLAIECTAEAGGEICVVHPANNRTAQQNAEIYLELLPFAKDCGVKIATENMWNWDHTKGQSTFAACATGEDFKKHVDIVNDPFLVACLDLGHAEMQGSGDGAVNMIKALGHRIQALHIHDNDRWNDNHQIPFSMDVDFEAIVRALKDIDYSGYFTLEAGTFIVESYTKDNLLEGMIELRKSVRKMADMFEQM